jgi:hypothetical protein
MKMELEKKPAAVKALSARAVFSAGVAEGMRTAGLALLILSFIVSLTVGE